MHHLEKYQLKMKIQKNKELKFKASIELIAANCQEYRNPVKVILLT